LVPAYLTLVERSRQSAETARFFSMKWKRQSRISPLSWIPILNRFTSRSKAIELGVKNISLQGRTHYTPRECRLSSPFLALLPLLSERRNRPTFLRGMEAGNWPFSAFLDSHAQTFQL
jgi:hypothetical protein